MNFWRILIRYGGWRLAVSVVAGVAGGAALAALMRLMHRVLTLPMAEHGTAAAQFVGLLLAYFIGTVLAQQSLNDAAERLQWELRGSLLRQMLATPLRHIERVGEARLFGLIGPDVRLLAEYLCKVPDFVVNLAIALGCFGYMAWLSLPVLVFNLGFVSLAAACYILPQRAAQRVGRAAAEANDKHTAELQYALRGVKPLQLNGARRRDFYERHFATTGAAVRRLTRRSRFIHLLSERFAEAMVLGNVACLLFVLPRWIDLPLATATGLLLAAIFARQPLKDSLDVLPRTQRIRVALRRMEEAGLRPFAAPPPEVEVSRRAATTFRELELDEVTFRYEKDHDQPGFVSGPYSLRISAGEVVFIVGGNGAGKTTLAKLLCGLYAPDEGEVRLDGAIIEGEAGRAALRARFSAVFTDDPLFGHVLGVDPAAAEREGNAILGELRLTSKVRLHGTSFNTIDLSQGQRRRLNLLGAILDERPILLLDEWAADQDPEFRAFFYDHLIPMLRARGTTVILITHDDRYFDRADRVLKLESGHAVELTPTA